MITSWNHVAGSLNGTIGCSNGHIHFRAIPVDRRDEHDEAIRELSNALPRDPGTLAQTSAFLCALSGLATPSLDLGSHIGFGPLPKNWKQNLDKAKGAIASAPAPAKEPQTLDELKAAHPELMKQHEDAVKASVTTTATAGLVGIANHDLEAVKAQVANLSASLRSAKGGNS